ncbi:MAG: nucleoside recognition domain-containing protein, partial [Enterovibrio sp.]
MQKSQSLSHPQFSIRNFLMFLIPSLLGVLLFMTPVAISDGFTIPVAYFAKSLLGLLGTFAPILIVGLVVMSTTIAVIAKITKPAFITKSHFLSALFLPTTAWLLVRIVGAFFVLMVYTSSGPALVTHESTGGFVLAELLPTLLSVFIFAGLFLPLLTNFGLLEFIGALMTKVMRPLFGLPGRSAVDCISSWLGDGSVAILMSS